MSTGFSLDPLPSGFGTPMALPGASVVDSEPESGGELSEARLLQETKLQIRSIVNEIARLSQSDVPIDQFYDQFLSRVISALAATGGAIWTSDDDGRLHLRYQINLAATGILDREDYRVPHTLLMKEAFHSGHATLVPPRSGSIDEDGEPGNPTEFLLIVAPLPLESRVEAVIEVFQRAVGGPTTQRGYLRFVVQMCELAIDYLKSHRLRLYSERQTTWQGLEQFALTIHRRLDSRGTAYSIVNDGRTLLGCDRLSLAVRRGNRLRIEAVSGLDTVDRRSQELVALGRLVDGAALLGEPSWLSSSLDDLPPQLEPLLQEYVDQTHSKLVGVVPLFAPACRADDELARERQEPIGALVVEQFKDSRPSHALRMRTGAVREHAATALANALDHEGVFLMPLWRSVGRSWAATKVQTLSRTACAACAIAVTIAALGLIPADLNLPAEGSLQPVVRCDVFAQVDGVVIDVPVEHGQAVVAGEVLARLRNTEVEVEVSRLVGQHVLLEQQFQANEQQRLRSPALSAAERNRLAVESADLRQQIASVAERLAIYGEHQRNLTIVAAQPGEVVTWQVGSILLRRPVRAGDLLMTLVDPASDWWVELNASERHLGHIQKGLSDEPAGLPVRFRLTSHPDREVVGRLVEIQRSSEAREEDQNRVRMRVEVERSELPALQSGMSVAAQVRCGRCSLGYSLLHDVIDTVRGKLLFWWT